MISPTGFPVGLNLFIFDIHLFLQLLRHSLWTLLLPSLLAFHNSFFSCFWSILLLDHLVSGSSCFWIICEKLLFKIRFFLFLRIFLACFSPTLLFSCFQPTKIAVNRIFLACFSLTLQCIRLCSLKRTPANQPRTLPPVSLAHSRESGLATSRESGSQPRGQSLSVAGLRPMN